MFVSIYFNIDVPFFVSLLLLLTDTNVPARTLRPKNSRVPHVQYITLHTGSIVGDGQYIWAIELIERFGIPGE